MSENLLEIPKLLKANEVAEVLRISKAQAYRLMRTGELKCVRFGPQTVRVRKDDLTEFIKENLIYG
jgi:excisionase family DNA binding protein